jgi:peptidoglycan/LPS O-acetylase OafA/YrhL
MTSALKNRLQKTLEGRNPSIDFIRGLAILVVVMLHFSMIYSSGNVPQPRFFSFYFWSLLSRNGYLGVSAFFVISGYLITSGALARYGQLRKISLFNFYTLRFARIVPPLFLLVAVNVVLHFLDEPTFIIQNLDTVSLTELFIGFSSLRLGLYWTVPVVGFSLGVLWSLSIEEMFYLFFPVICRSLRSHALLAAAFTGLIVYAVIFRIERGYPDAFFSYFGCFDLLALGCLLALFMQKFPSAAQACQRNWLRNSALLAAACVYLAVDARTIHVIAPSMMGLSIAIYILSAKPAGYSGTVSTFIRLMGVYSYEMYLFHIVVTQLMFAYVMQALDATSMFAGAVDIFFVMAWLTTTVISMLLSEFYSEPARHLIKKAAQRAHDRFIGSRIHKEDSSLPIARAG